MKKMLAAMVCAALMLSMAGCAGGSASTDPVGNVETTAATKATDNVAPETGSSTVEVSAEILEMLGMSAEEFAAMDAAKQQAILDEIGAALENQEKEEKTQAQTQSEAKGYTPDDVMAGGSYKVVLGDYMNSITLYYEDGVLVKLVESFQKSDEEEVESAVYEGDSLAEYGFNFIDWDGVPLQDILDGMKDYGGLGQYRISKSE